MPLPSGSLLCIFSDVPSFNSPFRRLKHALQPRAHLPSQPAQPTLQSEEEELFWREMADVVPLDQQERKRVESAPPSFYRRRPLTDPEAEALAELSDLVSGKKGFDITDTDEHVEGAVVGLDPRLMKKLRQGGFARQAHLDLHGMSAETAQVEVETFLTDALRRGLRCVLIVHGRGRNSAGQVPVLKDRLKLWLSRGKLAKQVLAFTTARPYDGGAGAMYVLLRRTHQGKKPIIILEGTRTE